MAFPELRSTLNKELERINAVISAMQDAINGLRGATAEFSHDPGDTSEITLELAIQVSHNVCLMLAASLSVPCAMRWVQARARNSLTRVRI